jgi:chromosome segregation ATPase
VIALIIGAGGGYAGARFTSGVSPDDITDRDRKITELQQTLSEMKLDSEQPELRARIKELEEQVDAANRTREKLRQYADEQAAKASSEAQAEIAALQKTIEEAGDLGRQLSQARKSLKVSELQLIELETAIKEQKAEIRSLREQLDQRGGDADAATKALTDQVKMLQTALSAAKKQAAEAPALRQQITELEAQLKANADGADAKAQKQIAALERQKQALETRLADALKSAEDAGSQAARIDDLRGQLDRMTDDLAARDAAARAAEKELKNVQSALKTSETRLAKLQTENANLADASGALEKQVAALKTEIADLKASKPPVAEKPADQPDDEPAADQPADADAGLTPRDRGEVERAVADLPGFDRLSPDKQETLVSMLERGECVTDSLKAAYGHVSAVSLRNLFRDLGGRC